MQSISSLHRAAGPWSTSRRLASLLAINVLCVAVPAHADEAALAAQIQILMTQVEALKAEVENLKAQSAVTPATMPSGAAPPAAPVNAPAATNDSGAMTPLSASVAGGAPFAPLNPEASPLHIGGYGEIAYNNYPKNKSQTEADLARAVLLFGYRFDDRTRFVSEFEWEHAVSSSSDQGEAEVEQFYVERSFTPTLAGRAGLFLIPSGMLNVAHEPTQYFGVTRDFVDTAIIPSTWREGGIAVTGITDFDLTWDAGITTGFNLAKWDPNSDEGKLSPLGSIHQELQFAKASNLSGYAALNWRGHPGLLVGGSVFYGKAAQNQPDFPSQNAAITLAEAHTRWTPGPFDFSAEYAQGHISDTAPYNLTVIGSPTPIPQSFYGWFAQAAWYAWQHGEYQLAPYARYERVNTGWKYATLADGLTPAALPTTGVFSVGASFFVTPNIVFKADYQWFSGSSDASLANRLQLGLGLNF